MNFIEFNAHADALIERWKAEKPLAIVRFGSSLYESNFLPGISDLDAFVISNSPLSAYPKTPLEASSGRERPKDASVLRRAVSDIENQLGWEYYPVTPNEFLRQVVTGNSFALCALLHGRVEYDPCGFIEGIYSLVERGVTLRPTPVTVECCAQSVGRQLSSAMNRYFSGDLSGDSPPKLLRNLSKICESLAMLRVMADKSEFLTGYTALRDALQDSAPALVEAMNGFRETLLERRDYSSEKTSRLKISSEDPLGSAILKAEDLYLKEGASTGIPVRMSTNELIDTYQHQHGELEHVELVRIDNVKQTHLILGKRTGEWRLFGFRAENGQPRPVDQRVSDESVDELQNRLRILR